VIGKSKAQTERVKKIRHFTGSTKLLAFP